MLLARPPPVVPPSAPATPGTTSLSQGAAHSAYSEVQQDFGKSVTVAAYSTVVMYLIILVALVATKLAGYAGGCVTWQDLFSPSKAAILVGLGALVALNLPLHVLFNVPNAHTRAGTVSTPALAPPKPANTTTPAAPVGTSDGGTLPAVTSASLTAGTSEAAPKKGATKVEKLPPAPQNKAEASSYLSGVEEAVSKIGQEAEELAAAAYDDVRSIEEKAFPTATEIKTMHAVSGELLDRFRDVPDRLTTQIEKLEKIGEVYGGILQGIEKGHQQISEESARHSTAQEAIRKDMEKMQQEMDVWLEPTHRILLAESVYKLALLAQQHVLKGKSSEYRQELKLQQLQDLYEWNQLDAGQARRWEEVVEFVGCCLSMEELLLVERHLRTVRWGAAHGYDEEKATTTLEQLQSWAHMHYSQQEFPDVHKPLLKMLDVLAGFSSIERPCLPDRSFESMLHPSLRQKI